MMMRRKFKRHKPNNSIIVQKNNNNNEKKYFCKYTSKKLFQHTDDQIQCNKIITTLINLQPQLPLSINLIIECAEYATGKIILCGGIHKCQGEILLLQSHNFNQQKINNWINIDRTFIYTKKSQHSKEKIEVIEGNSTPDKPQFNSASNQHLGGVEPLDIQHLGGVEILNPYSSKYCGIRKYNSWRCFIYRCTEIKCKRELNIFKCCHDSCMKKYFIVEEGETYGIGNCTAPPGVCTNAGDEEINCQQTFCSDHRKISGIHCDECGDWYCNKCAKNFGLKCMNEKCNKWYCVEHISDVREATNGELVSWYPWCDCMVE